ncbi:COPI associated protein [Novymonas esmeraldas]|uniref:COPI associated protein n=1 Tax=Novymonas esmeraldas TaxID=1808958 RepID=A0AAW0ESD2_9TRYP
MAPRPNFNDILHSRPFPLILKILNILGAFACGSYVLFLFIQHKYGDVRTFCALLYLLAFSIVIPSAEAGLMNHPLLASLARFLVSPIGRAFLYVFMGGVILGVGIGGWVIGIYLLAIGAINIAAACILKP